MADLDAETVLLVSGSPRAQGNTDRLLQAVGIELETAGMRAMPHGEDLHPLL
jgi:hypothetical protein